MKKVMIIDDEPLARAGIKSLIKWEDFGYVVVADAADGQEALEKIEIYNPDIVLTDLMMEPMDGFTLISKSLEKHSQIKFIVLSNFNDFGNVRKAMKLGAFDYIFKLTVKPNELLKILNESRNNIIAEDITKESKQVVNRNLDVIKKKILHEIIETNYTLKQDAYNILKGIPLKIDFNKPYYVFYLTIDNLIIVNKNNEVYDWDLINFAIDNIINELIHTVATCEVFLFHKGVFVIVINYNNENYNEFAIIIKKIFTTLVGYIKKCFGYSISAVLSCEYNGIEFLKEAIEKNIKINTNKFFHKPNEILFFNEITKIKNTEKDKNVVNHKLDFKALEIALENADFENMKELVKDMLSFLRVKKEWSPCEIKKELKKIYKKLYTGFMKYSIDIEIIYNRDLINMKEVIKSYDYYMEIQQEIIEFLSIYMSEYCITNGRPCRKEIGIVKSYVKNNLNDDLSVFKMAMYVNMSESRFAHVFKEEAGISFGEYVNQIRLERAERLLKETNMRVGEISGEIGFCNQNYFSTNFKKKTGMSPNEFRKNIWNNYK